VTAALSPVFFVTLMSLSDPNTFCYNYNNEKCEVDQVNRKAMQYLWSPWRMKYIMDHERGNECIFCAAIKSSDDRENLVLYRAQHNFVIMNLYPYTSGHIMIVPYDHTAVIKELSPVTRGELMELISRAETVLDGVYRAEGYNVGANIGAAAGAGIANHIHFHVVPRWAGDTNFMSSLANTRVLPEALEDTYLRLSEAWNREMSQ
jgi:ATP adenylyltransferase